MNSSHYQAGWEVLSILLPHVKSFTIGCQLHVNMHGIKFWLPDGDKLHRRNGEQCSGNSGAAPAVQCLFYTDIAWSRMSLKCLCVKRWSSTWKAWEPSRVVSQKTLCNEEYLQKGIWGPNLFYLFPAAVSSQGLLCHAHLL